MRTASSPASPVAGLHDAVAVACEVEVDEIGDVGLIVDDDDGASFHPSIVARVPGEASVRGM